MGATDEAKARVLMWNAKVEQQGLWAVADAFRNSAKGLKGRALTGLVAYPQIPELAARGRGRVEEFFVSIDRQLASNEYIVGDSYSIADITAMVVVDFSAWIKLSVPDNLGNIRRCCDSSPGCSH